MLFRKKTKTQEDGLARVVRWAVMIFFAYILFSGGFHNFENKNHPASSTSSGAATTAAADSTPAARDCNPENPYSNFSAIAQSLVPSFLPVIRSTDVTPGTGASAVCGQHVAIHYEYSLPNGSIAFTNYKADPAKVILGDGRMLRGMEMGIIGMKPGGERSIDFPPAFGFGRNINQATIIDIDKYAAKPGELRDTVLTGRVTLISAWPDVPETTQPLRVIERKFNSGARVNCGDTVRMDITVWKLDGTKLYSSDDEGRPVVFTLGASEAPYGIEQAIIGMGEGGERTAIIPASYMKPLRTDVKWPGSPRLVASDLSWPDETVLAELHLVHIGPEMATLAGPVATSLPTVMPPPATTPALLSGSRPGQAAPAKAHHPVKSNDDTDDGDDDDKPEKSDTDTKPAKP